MAGRGGLRTLLDLLLAADCRFSKIKIHKRKERKRNPNLVDTLFAAFAIYTCTFVAKYTRRAEHVYHPLWCMHVRELHTPRVHQGSQPQEHERASHARTGSLLTHCNKFGWSYSVYIVNISQVPQLRVCPQLFYKLSDFLLPSKPFAVRSRDPSKIPRSLPRYIFEKTLPISHSYDGGSW